MIETVSGGPAPVWTVVIPTFDRHETLTACLGRLAPGSQSLDASRYEVVVTDDARSSVTRAMLSDRFPWVRYSLQYQRSPHHILQLVLIANEALGGACDALGRSVSGVHAKR